MNSLTGMGSTRRISTKRVSAEITELGACLCDLVFRLGDGRTVMPLARAPWLDDAAITGDLSLPAHLRFLAGEWPCVPFGRTSIDPIVHGFGTDNCWSFTDSASDNAKLEIIYPDTHPVASISRTIALVPDAAAVHFTLSVKVRKSCRMPIGVHPILQVPVNGERISILGGYGHGEIYPTVFEPGISSLKPGAEFADLNFLPLAAGGSIAIDELVQQRTEETFLLFDLKGALSVVYPIQRYRVNLSWDATELPSCQFWLSCGGRFRYPWLGKFRGIGVEPLNGQYSLLDTGLYGFSGGRYFAAGEEWSTSYAISVDIG